MMILHKDGRGMTNSDNMSRMVINGMYLTAHMVDGSSHTLGRYDTEEDAKKAFDMYSISLTRDARGRA